MRITGGLARSIPLRSPKGDLTRPATDRSREAVFSSLGPPPPDCAVLDLFAGTGAYGLEALSRGAPSACFVDASPKALAALKPNLQAVLKALQPANPTTRVVCADALRWPPPARFDWVFVDPPYALLESHLQAIVDAAFNALQPAEHARLILECPGHLQPQHPNLFLRRRLGKLQHNAPSIAIFSPTSP